MIVLSLIKVGLVEALAEAMAASMAWMSLLIVRQTQKELRLLLTLTGLRSRPTRRSTRTLRTFSPHPL
jgi:hypothetical protein